MSDTPQYIFVKQYERYDKKKCTDRYDARKILKEDFTDYPDKLKNLTRKHLRVVFDMFMDPLIDEFEFMKHKILNIYELHDDNSVFAEHKEPDPTYFLNNFEYDVDFVIEIISAGIDVNTKSRNGYYPINIAILNEDVDSVNKLIKMGARVDFGENLAPLRSNPFCSCWCEEPQDYTANNVKIVKLLLENGAKTNIYLENGNTILQNFINNSHLWDGGANVHLYNIVLHLLEYGADPNNTGYHTPTARRPCSRSLLELLVEYSRYGYNLHLIQLLIEYGININDVIQYRYYDKDADGNYMVEWYTTPLIRSLSNGLEVFDENPDFPMSSSTEKCTLLLLTYGADPNTPDDRGVTPLCEAIDYINTAEDRFGTDNNIKILLEAGAHKKGATTECTKILYEINHTLVLNMLIEW